MHETFEQRVTRFREELDREMAAIDRSIEARVARRASDRRAAILRRIPGRVRIGALIGRLNAVIGSLRGHGGD